MGDVFTIVSVAVGAYVATNLDNLTILVTLLARYKSQSWIVALGYLASTLLIGLIGFWIGKAAGNIPVEYLGLLGLVPMSIGAVGVVRILRGKTGVATATQTTIDGAPAAFVTTFVSQLSNGADTIVTFAALFADSQAASDLLIIFTLAAMAIIFVCAAIYGVRHPALKQWIDRNAHRLTPWILIIVGAYIVANTATDLMPGQ